MNNRTTFTIAIIAAALIGAVLGTCIAKSSHPERVGMEVRK